MSKRKAGGGAGSDSDDATKGQDLQAVSRSGRMRKKSSRLIELEEESINEEALNYELNHARSFMSSKKTKPVMMSSQKLVVKSATPPAKSNTSKGPASLKSPGSEVVTPAKKQAAIPFAVSTPASAALTETPQAKKKTEALSKPEATPVTPVTARGAANSSSVGLKGWLSPDHGRSETLSAGGRGKKQLPAASVPTMNLSSPRVLSTIPRGNITSSSILEDDFDNDDDVDDDDIVNQLIEDGELDIDDEFPHSEDEESDVNDDDDDEMDDYETEDGGGSKDSSSVSRAGPSGAAASKFFEKQKPKGVAGLKKAKRRRNRAPTAYTLWCNSYRQKIVAQNPGIDFASMSKRLGEIWHALPQKEKVQWKKKAKKLAAQGLTSAPPEPAVRQRLAVNLLATGSKSAAAAATHRSSPSSGGGSGSKTTVTVTAVQQKKAPVASTKDATSDHAAASRLPAAAADAVPAEHTKQEPYKVVTSEPLDVAAHLKLLGESLSLIGIRLTNQANIAVQGSLTVLLDSMLCAAGALTCLTQQVPEMDGIEPEVHLSTLDNMAYFMPGI